MAENKKVNQLNNLDEVPAVDDKFIVWDESAQETKYVTKEKVLEDVSGDITDIENDVTVIQSQLSEVDNTTGKKAVSTGGDQTIGGNKTFENPITTVAPTSDLHTATKKYVDDKDDENVKKTGDQTISDVKTFNESPIVPTPTTDYQSAPKKYVDDAISGVNKNSVGLFTQGSFIDAITTNLQFNKVQEITDTALTGANTPAIDTLDGVNFLTHVNDTLTEFSLSGTVFTQLDQFVGGVYTQDSQTIVKYVNSTRAVACLRDGSRVYFSLYDRTGSVWSRTAILSTVITNYSDAMTLDIQVIDDNTFVYVHRNGDNNFILMKHIYTGGNLILDGTFGTSGQLSFNPGGDSRTARFISDTEVLCSSNTGFYKYTFTSSTATQNWSAALSSFSYFTYLGGGKVLDSADNTYDISGISPIKISDSTSTAHAPTIQASKYTVYGSIIYAYNFKIELGPEGLENSIEDLNATGHLGYMASYRENSTEASATYVRDMIINGSTNNDGTYDVISCTPNKIMLHASTPVAVSESEEAMIKCDLSDREKFDWSVKGNNYYLKYNTIN